MRAFNLPYLKWFKDKGYEVHAAFENRFGYEIPHADRIIDLPFKRNPFHPQNYRAYKQLKELVKDHQYELIHCHTPIPAAITRLAAAVNRKCGTKVLYTAHGFHFYKGASLKNWLIYFTAEKLLSKITDGIITINNDDYQAAQKHLSSSKVFNIPGIGVDVSKYRPRSPEITVKFRQSMGLSSTDFIVLYVAEFIPRKNHRFILDVLPELIKQIPNLKILFAGRGALLEQSQEYVKESGLDGYVHFLGFRKDLDQITPAVDVCVSCSKQEGLPLGPAEGMMCAKPIVVSDIRGHSDLIDHGEQGFLFRPNDKSAFIQHIVTLYKNPLLKDKLGIKAFNKIQKFSIDQSLKAMDKIYCSFLEGTDNRFS